MTRTLRRLARIQRIVQDEARNDLISAEQVLSAHDDAIARCHEDLAAAREGVAEDVDDLMRRHAYSLRVEMQRRRLVAQGQRLADRVERRRGRLLEAAQRVQTTERFTDRLETIAATDDDRRAQRQLDEAGLLVWQRRVGAM